jgi:hypothetical protein
MFRKIGIISLLALAVAGYSFGTCNIDILTESLPYFFIGQSYNVQIQACCGTAPYTFTVYSGSLPPGLSMSSSGLITGTPTTSYHDTFCVTVTDSVGCHLTYCYDVTSGNG